MKVTNKEIKMCFRGTYDIVIPKGTKVTNKTAMGIDDNYNFINDFKWIPLDINNNKQFGLIHDATYYGINIDKKDVEVLN